jgi:hypothetical protein
MKKSITNIHVEVADGDRLTPIMHISSSFHTFNARHRYIGFGTSIEFETERAVGGAVRDGVAEVRTEQNRT